MAPALLIVIAVMRQHTIRKAVCLEGVGLHSGKTVRVTLAPGPADSGIVFRIGEHGDPIPATPESVVDSYHATTPGKHGARIQTIQHTMAAAPAPAPARTYGCRKELGFLRKSGRALGASLDNTIVIGKGGTLNGLRYRDEFVRHKVLDLLGDLALLGRRIAGHVIARNAGHALNFELVVAVQRALGLDRRTALRMAPAPAAAEAAEGFAHSPGLAAL